jgi:non-ribosomal peptide synthetase component F/acyl carrier protein
MGGTAVSDPAAAGRPPALGRPLTHEQLRDWVHYRLRPASVSAEPPISARLRGALSLAALDAAIAGVQDRHESLRSRFPCDGGVPRVVAGPRQQGHAPLIDISGLRPPDRDSTCAALLAAMTDRPFDLAAGPVWRPALIRLGPGDHALIIGVHDMIADLWSVTLIVDELGARYERACQGRPAAQRPAQDRRPAVTRELTPERRERLRRYWHARLAGQSCAPLPVDHPRPALPGLSTAVLEFPLPAELSHGLRRLSRDQGVTLYATLLAALGALINRWCGHEDHVAISMYSARRSRAAEHMVDSLVQVAVVRVSSSGDPPFTELLARALDSAVDALDHAGLPFAEIVAMADPGRDLEPSPLRQVGLSLHNIPPPGPPPAGLVIEPLPAAAAEISRGTSEGDLWLEVYDDGVGPLLVQLQMDDRLFEPGTLRLTALRLRTLLQAITEHPETRLSALPLVSAEEHEMLAAWGDGPLSPPDCPPGGHPVRVGDTVTDWLDRACRCAPDAIALRAGSRHLTLGGLDRQAAVLAGQLRAAGVADGDLVRIHASGPAASLVGLLAALRAGAGVVWGPGDPRPLPGGPLRFGIAGARLEVAPVPRPGGSRISTATADGLAGAYQSGGKLLACPHRLMLGWAGQLARRIAGLAGSGQVRCPGLDRQLGPFALLVPLLAGPRCLLAEWDGSDRTERGAPGRAGVLACAGYAPADVPGWVTVRPAASSCDDERGRPAYGKPVGTPRLRVLDQALGPVPAGTAGEVCLAGPAMPWGFLGRPAQTAWQFAPDPGGAGGRIWRTGEPARFRHDGTLEPAGPSAGWVELGGRWINVTEVASVLSAGPGAARAEISVRDVPADGGVIVPRLVARIWPADAGSELSAAALRRFAARRLPWYAIPSAFFQAGSGPGQAEVPDGAAGRGDTLLRAAPRRPRSPAAREVAGLIESLLGQRQVCLEDNFFRLGGSSVDALRLCAALRDRFGAEIALFDVMTAPTVGGITRVVQAARRRQHRSR